MKILAIISTVDFINFTRRATIEAISEKVDQLDLLFYVGVKNILKKKFSSKKLNFSTYHFWLPDMLKQFSLFSKVEYWIRKKKWLKKIQTYDVLFFTDPNQAYLLPYTQSHKIVYLIRDPNALQSQKQHKCESDLIKKADLIVATSYNLANQYILKYHNIQHSNVRFWANCADLSLWNINKISSTIQKNITLSTIGMAGNINRNTDIALLDYITEKAQHCLFILCGNIFLEGERRRQLERILKKKNLQHIGLIELDRLPEKVYSWDIGITIEAINEYTHFTHHNKIYQYLALGIPVVSLKIHDDYNHLHPYVQTTDTYDDFLKALDYALEISNDEQFRKNCVAIAHENSSAKRADSFVRWLEQLF